MSNAYDEFLADVEPAREPTEGGKLREKLEAAIKLLHEKDKQIKGLTQQVSGKLVEDFLTKNEVPAKFHKLAKKELGDNPDEDAFTNFMTEYGDLWDADGGNTGDTVNPEQQAIQNGLEKIHNASREARNLTAEPFKMPSNYELSRMNEAQLAQFMANMPVPPKM